MKIANKISISCLLTAVLLGAIAGALFYSIAKTNLEQAIFAHLDTTAKSRAHHIENLLEERKREVELMAESFHIETTLETIINNHPDSTKLIEETKSELEELLCPEIGLYETFILNPDGKIIASTDQSRIGLDKSTDAYFLAAKNKTYIKDAYYSQTTKRNSICISTPVRADLSGKLLGVLVARYNLKSLRDITAERTGLGETGEVYLVNKDKLMITPSRFVKDTVLRQKVDTEKVRELFEDVEEFGAEHHPHVPLIYEDYRGTRVLGIHDHIPEMQWYLLAEINQKEALAPLAKIKRLGIIIMLLIPVVAWLIGTVLARFISKPIHELHRGTEIIGAGNLDYKVGTDAKDEIGQLARAFDKMTGDLAKTTTSIDKLNDQITQQKQLEESLRQAHQAAQNANEAKSDSLANMSHEIRTPMTAILGYTDLLMDPDLTPSDRDNHLAVIRRNGEHLLSLINDILDLSKIEAGKLSMEAQPCNLLSIVADVASMMRVRADQRATSLSTHYTNQLPEIILTDGPRLRQMLVNLVGNAIKFTENGSVRIVVTFLPDWRDQKPAVQIQVIDTGIGISEEKLAKLFDPFVQADSSTSRKYGGTGLGLAITKHITELLAGELTAQSTPGVGSTFTLVVPTGSLEGVKMLDSPAEVVRQLSAQGHGPQEKNLTGLCILLAEDGIDNQNLISYLIRKAGAHVEVADNGKIAVQKASDQPFDVILMDIQMPEMDGYEATRVLRKRGFTHPILALTAHAMSNDREKCLQVGFDDYMAKPINPAKLIQMVARYGGKKMPTDQTTTDPTHKPSTAVTQPIESEFADDPDFTQIIDQFVAGLTDKVESMQEALNNADFETLQRLAHQLKGAGGSYGYPALTDSAKALEEAAKARDHEAAGLAFTPLAKLCQAIIAARKAETPSDGA